MKFLKFKNFTKPSTFGRSIYGGDERDRTADPLLAKQVLSQLSYIPSLNTSQPTPKMVGLTGVEPVTSPLSGVRSNQLSYRPNSVTEGYSLTTQKFNFNSKEQNPNLVF